MIELLLLAIKRIKGNVIHIGNLSFVNDKEERNILSSYEMWHMDVT